MRLSLKEKTEAGGLGGAEYPPAVPRQIHDLRSNHEILEKTENHKAGEIHAIWRIWCFIKQ